MQKPIQASANSKTLNSYLANDIMQCINTANTLIAKTVTEIKQGSYLEFSSALSHESAGTCYDSLVVDRLVNKFSYGESLIDTKAAAFSKYVNFEETHCKHIAETYEFWGPSKAHLHVRQASVLLRRWCRNFRFDLLETMIEFTPGETFVSTKGDVSLEAKLSLKEHWTTTWNSLDLTCKLIYNNLGLKRAARAHIGEVDSDTQRTLYAQYRKSKNLGFEVFRRLLIDRVLTIVDGARASSVPKNIDTDRFINIETMFCMMLQRIVAATFRKVLSRVGNSLSNRAFDNLSAQGLHGLLIKFSGLSTVDFTNASDSVILHAVTQVFPKPVSDVLIKTRSQFIDFGEYVVEPYKLSSMGNGYTFEVMTLLLFAMARVSTKYCRVYGDDVILPNEHTPAFISACKLIGFIVNEKKSFICSQFRESCGAFYHDDAGYFLSFDVGVITSMADIITTANKLYLILNNENSGLLSPCLVSSLTILHTNIMLLIPVLQKGYPPITRGMEYGNLSLYAYDPYCVRKHKKNVTARALRSSAIDDVSEPNFLTELDTAVLVLVPRWKPLKRERASIVFQYQCFLFAGRVTAPTIKGMGKWVLIPYFITETGSMLLANQKGNDSIESTFSSRRELSQGFRAISGDT